MFIKLISLSSKHIFYQDYQRVSYSDTANSKFGHIENVDYPLWNDHSACLLCSTKLVTMHFESEERVVGHLYERKAVLSHCKLCGWWNISNAFHNIPMGTDSYDRIIGHTYWPLLKLFDIGSTDIPIQLLKDYLRVHYSDVKQISAQKAEELVRSVFRDYYGNVEVEYFKGPVYSADGGIDLAIIDTEKRKIGVQVKRRQVRRVEPIEQIRAFVTSLLMKGIRKGVYVALSSKFSKATSQIPKNIHLQSLGLELDLMDSDRFHSVMNNEARQKSEKPIWYKLLETTENCSNPDYIEQLISFHSR